MTSFTTRRDNCFANDYSTFIQTSDDVQIQDVSMDESLDLFESDSIDDRYTANVLRSPFTPIHPHVECVMGPIFTLQEAITHHHEEFSPIDNCSTSSQSMFGQNINRHLMFRPKVTAGNMNTDHVATTAVSLDSCIRHQSRHFAPIVKSDTQYVGTDLDGQIPGAAVPMLPDFNEDDDTDDEILAEYNHRVPSLKMRPASRRLEFLD
jgi:hypothetical protein